MTFLAHPSPHAATLPPDRHTGRRRSNRHPVAAAVSAGGLGTGGEAARGGDLTDASRAERDDLGLDAVSAPDPVWFERPPAEENVTVRSGLRALSVPTHARRSARAIGNRISEGMTHG